MKRIVKFLCLMLLMIIGSVGQVLAGGHSSHTGAANAGKVTNHANGKVYIAASSTKPNAEATSTNVTWSCSKTESKDNTTIYWWAVADAGHYFAGWHAKQDGTDAVVSTNSPYNETLNAQTYTSSKPRILYAKFVGYTVTAPASPAKMTANPGEPKAGDVTFKTESGASKSDFDAPSFTSAPGGTWDMSNWDVAASGEISVSYTFTPSGDANGDYSATLSLKSKGEATAKTVTIPALVKAAANNDAQRLDAAGNIIGGSEGSLSTVIAAASDGQTVQLLRNVSQATVVTITKSITLDFAGYVISGTANNLITIKGADKEVTFIDTDKGGGISLEMNTATKIYAVDVQKGTLNIKGGNIECTNKSTSTASDSRAHGVRMEAGAIVNMTGGSVISNSDGYMSNGFIVESTGTVDAVLTVSGGVITANGAVRTRGILGYGIINIKDGATVKATASSSNSYGVMISQSGGNGRLYMDGGVVSGEGATGSGVQTNNAACAFDIKGGSVSGGVNALNINNASTSGVVVHGGMFTGAIVHNNNKFLKGGYYTAQPAAAAIATNYLSYPTLDGTAIRDAGYTYGVGGSEEGAIVCKVIDGTAKTTTFFSSIAAALDYVNQNNNNTTTIILTANCTLPAGYYTLPAKATLLVPYKADQTAIIGANSKLESEGGDNNKSVFRRLTLADGANLDVYGTIEVSALMNVAGQAPTTIGNIVDNYGQILMKKGSHMTLQDKSKLYAWGYISGDKPTDAENLNQGTIDARRGSEVHEMFQIKDWPGGTNAKDMKNNLFPITSYYIQNIEVPITFRPGSKEVCSTGANVSIVGHITTHTAGIIGVDGETALFLMSQTADANKTFVRKYYNPVTNKQVYEINSSASLGSIQLQFGSYVNMQSKDYNLPITNNMYIHVLSGNLNINQSIELLPGAEIEVDKECTLTINKTVKNSSNQTLNIGAYFIDLQDWGSGYIYTNGGYAQRHLVKYSPSWIGGSCPSTPLKSAKLNVHGTVLAQGSIYTTPHGADIISTNDDAGKIQLQNGASIATATSIKVGYKDKYQSLSVIPALLKNVASDNTETFTDSKQVADEEGNLVITPAGAEFGYLNYKWQHFTTSGCFSIDQDGVYYAQPADLVALSSGTVDAETHLYYSSDKSRNFILMDGCQWWEVEQTEEDDAVFYCAKNNRYYTYNTTSNKWEEKKVSVSWVNYDGTPLKDASNNDLVYPVRFGDKPEYLGTNPTRPASAYYTYSFVGWLPEITEDTKVFENTTFIAQYEEKEIRYTVTFQDEAGKTIETQFVKVGEVPVCSFQPTKQGYYLYWKNIANNDPIAAVSKNVTYRAYYEEIPKTTFTIIFQNYNGTELQKYTNVAEGTKPAYTGAAPTKDAIKDWTYEFAGWTPDIAPATEDMTYVAKYNAVPRKYKVTFHDNIAAGTGITNMAADEVYQLGYGEVPVCQNPPVKESNAEYYYTVVWDKNIAAVTGDITYTATGFVGHKNTLRLAASADVNGSVTVTKDDVSQELSAIYDYGTELVVTATPNAHYQFKQWSDGNMDNPRTIMLTETKNIQALFELEKMTITWQVDNQTIATSQVDYGTVPSYTGATPNKPSICGFYFTFAGWSPAFSQANAAQTYTAQFNKIANPSLIAYQVEFNGNGATAGSMPNQGFDAGVSQKLSANAYVNARTVTFNYNGNGQAATTAQSAKAFQGWQDANDDSKTYTDGHVVKNLADDCDHATITLKAQWAANYAAVTLPAPSKMIAGRTFAGWYDAQTGGNRVGGAGDSYNPSADVTLYAHWGAVTYTVRFENEGGALLQSVVVEHGQTPVFTEATPTKAATAQYSYTFNGWDPAIVAAMANATYTATYTATKNKYSITFQNEGGAELQKSDVEYGVVPSYIGATPAKAATAEYTYTFKGWDVTPVAVTGEATYTATYSATKNKYTITFANIDGNGGTSEVEYEYGATPSYAGTPAKAEDATYTYEFSGWDEDFATVTEAATYTAQFTAHEKKLTTTTITVQDNDVHVGETSQETPTYVITAPTAEIESITLVSDSETPTSVTLKGTEASISGTIEISGENMSLVLDNGASITTPELILGNGGTVEVIDGSVTTTDLVIRSVSGSNITSTDVPDDKFGTSGRVNSNSEIEVTRDAYFELELTCWSEHDDDPSYNWHAFSVPFPVALTETGSVQGDNYWGSKTWTNQTFGKNYSIATYDGAKRARGQLAAWTTIDKNSVLQPGVFYFMTVDGWSKKMRFKKAAGADLYASNEMNVNKYEATDGNTNNAGWNGLGNSTLDYASANGVSVVTILDPVSYSYATVDASSISLATGAAFFVQASDNGTVTVGEPSASVAARAASSTDKVRVALKMTSATYRDNLFLTASSDASVSYEAGRDLEKMKMSATPNYPMVAANAYGLELSAMYTPWVNGEAIFPLSLYAPEDGLYTIAIRPTDEDVYLLQNGYPIANLSYGNYSLYLNQGNSYEYSIGISRRRVATDLDENEGADDHVNVQKIYWNKHIYILRDGQMYDATGKSVK